MNCLLKMLGFKTHDSINRDLIRHEKREFYYFTDTFYYWCFFHTT